MGVYGQVYTLFCVFEYRVRMEEYIHFIHTYYTQNTHIPTHGYSTTLKIRLFVLFYIFDRDREKVNLMKIILTNLTYRGLVMFHDVNTFLCVCVMYKTRPILISWKEKGGKIRQNLDGLMRETIRFSHLSFSIMCK